jgi:hypothetical protein
MTFEPCSLQELNQCISYKKSTRDGVGERSRGPKKSLSNDVLAKSLDLLNLARDLFGEGVLERLL